MRILGAVILAALILWSIFWWHTAQNTKKSVDDWFGQQSVDQDPDYNKVSISGFPNRLDLTIKNGTINSYRGKFLISANVIQFLTLLYDKDFIISVIQPPIDITYKNQYFRVESGLLKSSFNFSEEKELHKIVTEGSNLRLLDPKKNNWGLKKLLFASEKETTTLAPTYRSHLTLDNITIPKSYLDSSNNNDLIVPVIKKISVDSIINFSKDFYKIPSPNKILQINNIIITIDWGFLTSVLKGNVKLSKNNLLNGSFKIKVSNWRALLKIFQKEKLLDKKLLKTIKAGLTFIASQDTNRDQSVTVPITVKNNFIFLGPIIVGKIDDKFFM
jgi:hypothetical protein